MQSYRSPLHQTVSTTPTEFWNDSCSVPELNYAIEHGATGATSNPFIVFTVLKGALADWKDRIRQIIVERPTWDEEQIAQQVYEEVGVRGSKVLLPSSSSGRACAAGSPSRPIPSGTGTPTVW